MKIIDLSVTLGGPDFVGPAFFPPVVFESIHTHEVHGKANSKISSPVHAGTHADAAFHSLPDGATIDEMPLERFVGQAVLIDLTKHTKPDTPITLEQLVESAPSISLRNKIAVLYSGWLADHYGTQDYYEHYPSLTPEATQWLIDQGAKAVAMDFAIDAGAATTREGGFGNHRLVHSAGMPIIENVANLDQLPVEFQFIGLPAKFHRADGAPVRAVAIIEESTAREGQPVAKTDTATSDLPASYDPEAFAFFTRYFTEENARRFFEFVRTKDEDFFRLWQAWVPAGMYSRTVIDQKTREMCAIAASVALNALPQVRAHVTGALYAGATKEEALEVILQQGVYSGLPYAIQALAMWDEAVAAYQEGGGFSGL